MTYRKCSFEGCDQKGDYKAPSSPGQLKEYIWFCLKHIKEYNKKWNYFSDMTADEIEEFIENDIIGHRKVKNMSTNDANYFEKINKISENMFGDMHNLDSSRLNPTLYSSKYLGALATLGIEDKNMSIVDIKSKFKKIVKELHPDTVGPVENNKEKLVKILEAYKVIKEHHGKYGQAKSQST
mgnify:FL=1